MDDKKPHDKSPRLPGALAVVLGIAASSASAQMTDLSTPESSMAPDPNPYYIGVSETLRHDSNVYRIPSGASDNYSVTSVDGGFDQLIGRQRVFGTASVGAYRYHDQTQLDHTAYALTTGIDWSTIETLSGSLRLGLNQSLSAPAVSGQQPVAQRNLARTDRVDAVGRWGGPSLLTLEGTLGYVKLDYSAPQYSAAESRQDLASLALYYRPGGFLRVGVAGRFTRTETPKAVQLSNGDFESNTTKGDNLDLLGDYEVSGFVNASGRISYTKQTNSGINTADFSGLTGNLSVNYQPTGKLAFNLYVSRESGFNASSFNTFTVQPGPVPVLTPVTGLYENNRLTNSAGLGVNYSASAKVSANAGLRYSRARLVATLVTASSSQATPDTTDVLKDLFLGVNYLAGRNWTLGCNLSHEIRDLTGATAYSYTDNTIGCSGQYTWR